MRKKGERAARLQKNNSMKRAKGEDVNLLMKTKTTGHTEFAKTSADHKTQLKRITQRETHELQKKIDTREKQDAKVKDITCRGTISCSLEKEDKVWNKTRFY